jgi:hypothetical protein
MAEREGFEPSKPFRVYTLSRRADSTTLTPLRIFRIVIDSGELTNVGSLVYSGKLFALNISKAG